MAGTTYFPQLNCTEIASRAEIRVVQVRGFGLYSEFFPLFGFFVNVLERPDEIADARVLVSTYPTMLRLIDETKDENVPILSFVSRFASLMRTTHPRLSAPTGLTGQCPKAFACRILR